MSGAGSKEIFKGLTVAIDGPAGSGKSTVAVALAARLGIPHLDTGSMYRALALKVLQSGITPHDEAAVVRAASEAGIRLESGRTWLDGVEVTSLLRSAEVDAVVSQVASHAGVRTTMVRRQREFALEAGGVLEGRDIATVVLPDAHVKVYLTASPEERARRRAGQLGAAGEETEAEEVLAAMEARDMMDSSRAASPLRIADGAFIVDSTKMTLDEVVGEIEKLCRQAVQNRQNPQRRD